MDSAETAMAHVAIRNLYAAYTHALDGNDAEAVARCFIDDGALFPNQNAEPIRGRDALREFVASTSGSRPRHIILNLHIGDVHETRPRCEALFLLFSTENGEISAAGTYDDTVILDSDGEWRIAEKRANFLWRSAAYEQRYRSIAAGAAEPDAAP